MNKRIIVTSYGDADVLRMIEEPVPQPEKDEVLIRVEAAGVALGDVMRRKGVLMGGPTLPFTPGYDIVGRIEQMGDGATRFRAGDRVAVCFDGIGGYSRYVSVREQDAHPVPESLDPHDAVCLVLNYVTAYQLLHRAVQTKGLRRILIHGAAGGVGTALLQMGQLLGLEMIGTASESKLPTVRSYGAWGIDYRREDFVQAVRNHVPEGIDAVFDPIGGENWHRSAQTLKPGGALIAFGFTSALAQEPTNEGFTRLQEDLARLSRGEWYTESVQASMYSITKWKKDHPDWFRDDLHTVFQWLAEGRLKPVRHATLPLEEAAQAHRLMEHAQTIGKITLDGR
jgi:NADPH:quinone reductase-like Zn-dependent oxidoreductase